MSDLFRGIRRANRAPAAGRDAGGYQKTMLFAFSSSLEGGLQRKCFLFLVQNHFPGPTLQESVRLDRFGGEEKNYSGPRSRDPARFLVQNPLNSGRFVKDIQGNCSIFAPFVVKAAPPPANVDEASASSPARSY